MHVQSCSRPPTRAISAACRVVLIPEKRPDAHLYESQWNCLLHRSHGAGAKDGGATRHAAAYNGEAATVPAVVVEVVEGGGGGRRGGGGGGG